MRTIRLKIEQNGGEYHGYATIKGVPSDCKIVKGSKDITFGDIQIVFDELIEILEIS